MFRFTLGVEEEFQIIDPESCELRSHVSQLLESGESVFGNRMKGGPPQSVAEVGPPIRADVHPLNAEVLPPRRDPAESADRTGLAIAAAGTHPFSDWRDQVLSPGVRYES